MFEFWKQYYQRTDRVFADRVWGEDAGTQAWQKGQNPKVSKKERKVWLLCQYLLLLFCWVPVVWLHDIGIGIGMLFFSLLSFLITDFSILKVEWLRRVFGNGTAYGEVLRRAFFGEMDPQLVALQRTTKKYTGGYVCKDQKKFRARYFAVCRNRENEVLLTFAPRFATMKINDQTFRFSLDYPSVEELLAAMAEKICEELDT